MCPPTLNPAHSRLLLLQMVHTGVKVFERNSNARSAIDFRVCQEGLGLVLPYMTKRITRWAAAVLVCCCCCCCCTGNLHAPCMMLKFFFFFSDSSTFVLCYGCVSCALSACPCVFLFLFHFFNSTISMERGSVPSPIFPEVRVTVRQDLIIDQTKSCAMNDVSFKWAVSRIAAVW